ncbi:MAG TPA: competence/damage-inducible protein A [Ruminococcaceae bacterium]|nr:competence/damage-inducible protein A [Oscillospiraceae bacterium]
MNCEIICVGTEILLGDILNTNTRYLSQEMARLGFQVLHQCVVGDNAERLAEQLRESLARSEMVLLTGGLGPTADDITKEVCCEVMGAELVMDEDELEKIRAYFAKRGRVMADTNKKQALVPKNGIVFSNDHGTAPGCAIERDGRFAVLMPGPPREMRPMFADKIRPWLLQKSDSIIFSRMVRTFGIGESAMAEAVSDLLEGENPTVAPYAKDGEALLRVTAKAETQEKAEQMCDKIIAIIRERIGEYIYGIDRDGLEFAVVEQLKTAGKKLALAESCTGGWIAKRITDVPGASKVFECGVVSYANNIKMNLLGVKNETIERFTEVSRECAAEMAQGVRRLSGADYGLSVTGFAGPDPAEDGRPAGLIYIGLDSKNGTTVKELNTHRGGAGSRDYNRVLAASNALYMVLEEEKGKVSRVER